MIRIDDITEKATHIGKLGDQLETNVRAAAVKSLIKYTPPLDPAKAKSISTKSVRAFQQSIRDFIQGAERQMNTAIVGGSEQSQVPVKAEFKSSMPLVVARGGTPKRVEDAERVIREKTEFKPQPERGYKRVGRKRKQGSELSWTTAASWKKAAETFAGKAGNMLSGWYAADEWAKRAGARGWLDRAIPKRVLSKLDKGGRARVVDPVKRILRAENDNVPHEMRGVVLERLNREYEHDFQRVRAVFFREYLRAVKKLGKANAAVNDYLKKL